MKLKKIKSNILTFNAVFLGEEDGGYSVSIPALPGCFTQGRTFDEAISQAQEAISAFITVLARRGKRIPTERARVSPFVVSILIPNQKAFA